LLARRPGTLAALKPAKSEQERQAGEQWTKSGLKGFGF